MLEQNGEVIMEEQYVSTCMCLVGLTNKVEVERGTTAIGVVTFHCRVHEPMNCHTVTAGICGASDVVIVDLSPTR